MKTFLGIYLIVLGIIEVLFALFGEDVSPVVRPHGSILWSSFFVESSAASLTFSLLTGLVILAVGVSLFVGYRRKLLLGFAFALAALAMADLFMPIAVLFSGGSHALPVEGAALMLLVGSLTEVIPAILCALLAGRAPAK
jgi:hypothetical protein